MKPRVHLPLALLASLVFVVSACIALPPAANAPTNSAQPVGRSEPADPLSACPAATDALQRLVAPEGRYCLAYPAEYKVERPGAGERLLVIGGLLDSANPRAQINVTDAAGETAGAAADAVAAGFTDFKLVRSVRTVAGEPAVMLDKVPGQDINRRVLFVKNGLLYDITFAPADASAGDAFKRMEALQSQLLDSFTFLPSGFGVADECLTATGSAQLHRDPTRGYCLLYPAGYTVKQTDATEAVFFSGSLMDASKPKLFVRVEDANGQTAKELADTVAADVEAALPGQALDRPFGVTLGYEVAERLDNMPGQDVGRIVIAVHGPRAYRLAFVPADPADPAMFQQTEALYDLALKSFRFTQ